MGGREYILSTGSSRSSSHIVVLHSPLTLDNIHRLKSALLLLAAFTLSVL